MVGAPTAICAHARTRSYTHVSPDTAAGQLAELGGGGDGGVS
jgi:hypothetical protein